MAAILNWKKIDFKRIHYSAPIESGGGRKILLQYIQDNGKKTPIMFQTPRMEAPYGISALPERYWRNSEPNRKIAPMSLTLSFRNKDINPKVGKFYDFLQDLDDAIVAKAKKERATWLELVRNEKSKRMEPVPEDQVYAKLTPTIKEPDPSGKYADGPHTLKLKVPSRCGRITPKFYNRDKDLIASEQVPEGGDVRVLVELTSIWVVQGKMGVTMITTQVRSYGDSVPQMCMIEGSDDEEEEEDGGSEEPVRKKRRMSEPLSKDEEEEDGGSDDPARKKQ